MAAPGLYGEFSQGFAQGFSLVQEAQKNKAALKAKADANELAKKKLVMQANETLINAAAKMDLAPGVMAENYNRYAKSMTALTGVEFKAMELDGADSESVKLASQGTQKMAKIHGAYMSGDIDSKTAVEAAQWIMSDTERHLGKKQLGKLEKAKKTVDDYVFDVEKEKLKEGRKAESEEDKPKTLDQQHAGLVTQIQDAYAKGDVETATQLEAEQESLLRSMGDVAKAKRKPDYGLETAGDRYVDFLNKSYMTQNNGKEMPDKDKANALMTYKRAGSDEAAAIALAEKTGKMTAETLNEQYTKANAAVPAIEKIDELLTLIETSGIETGFAANLIKSFESFKVRLGGDAKELTELELMDAMMGSEVFPLIKQLGIGARGMDTPEERKFMRQVLTGEIELNKNTLKRMAEFRREDSVRRINTWNNRRDSDVVGQWAKYSGANTDEINIPTRNSTQFSVKAPDGKIYNFSDQESADKFKQALGK